MVERGGNIQHEEGSIAGKEQKPSISSELAKGERDAWKKVLGIEPEIKPLPESITPEVIKNLEKLGMELRYIPNLNLGTFDDIRTYAFETLFSTSVDVFCVVYPILTNIRYADADYLQSNA